MRYIPINQFEEFEINPFIDKAIKEIQEHTVKKRVFIKGNRSIINQVISDNGEIIGHSAFMKFIEVDDNQFVKLYLSRFQVFYDLSKNALKVFGYIINKCLVPQKDEFYFSFEECKKYTGYSGDNIIRSGLASLISCGIIAKSKRPYILYINPLVCFNGNRISFAETIVRKSAKNQLVDKTKLEFNLKLDFENEKNGL